MTFQSGLDPQLEALFLASTLPLKVKKPPHAPKKKVLVIAGPTAVGKTEISFSIAKAMGGEIISADSMQVYRGMDIGTAKPSLSMRREVAHHLVDSRDLDDESFNVMAFYREANSALKEILSRNHVPVVVGGTGFYLHALLYGPPSGPSSDMQLRQKLEQEMSDLGSLALYQRLQALDPDYAGSISHNDRQKIVRALEIISLTNQKVSQFMPSFHQEEESDHYDFRCWFLYLPKELLYPRIDARCDEMIAQGLIDEVRSLTHEGLLSNRTASQAIGYRQCLQYLQTAQSPADKKQFIQAFKQATKQYAKRQFTWFRKEPAYRWLNLASISRETVIELIIQDFEQSF